MMLSSLTTNPFSESRITISPEIQNLILILNLEIVYGFLVFVLPVLKYFLTFCTPTRQGNPYSLATTAPIYKRDNSD